jgi:DNA-binding CsgD family transcriptional regulator
LKKRTSYGIIKKNTIGGFVMPRGYRHIQEYEEEILRLKEEGKTKREIGKILGFSYEQVHSYITRYNRKQRKIEAGDAIKRKGRPPKDYQVNEADKAAQLRYIIARKDAKIKSLEMENELMRDFLSLTERK